MKLRLTTATMTWWFMALTRQSHHGCYAFSRSSLTVRSFFNRINNNNNLQQCTTTSSSSFSTQTQRRKTRLCSFSDTTTSVEKDNEVDISQLLQGRSNKQVWRPTKQDVERISWGKPAKKKGTGSRGVPHRLNQDERTQFDLARNKGFLEATGSAWRSQRRDAPLANTYRSWCDACGKISIIVHKSHTGVDDAVVVDVSPLRLETAGEFQTVAEACLQVGPSGGEIVNQGRIMDEEEEANNDNHDMDEENDNADDNQLLLLDSDAWETRPIYQLPPYLVRWENLTRQEAKQLGKAMAQFCSTCDKNRDRVSKKPVGVKPGKSRRHGGYGIG